MIPTLVDIGAPWECLPPGVHMCTLEECKDNYVLNPVRERIYKGLVHAASDLKDAGCRILYVDGSFVTSKPNPGDFDACWETQFVEQHLLHPVLLDFSNLRANQKARYEGELFPVDTPTHSPGGMFDFFQVDKFTGQSKGILKIDLRNELTNLPRR